MPEPCKPTEALLSQVVRIIETKKPWDEHLKRAVIEQFNDYFLNHPQHFFFLMSAYDIRIEIFIGSHR